MTRTSATGGPETGFTLIELMVVLVIVGITLGLVTLSIHVVRHDDLADPAHRLAAALALAQDESELTSRPVLLKLDRQGWRFLEESDQGMATVPEGVLPAGGFEPALDQVGSWPAQGSAAGGGNALNYWIGSEALPGSAGVVLQRGGQQAVLTPDGIGGYRVELTEGGAP